MHGSEAAENLIRCLRQGNEAIPVALGIADVHVPAQKNHGVRSNITKNQTGQGRIKSREETPGTGRSFIKRG